MIELYFAVNGPGEIAGWLYPLIRWLKEYSPYWVKHLTFNVILTPCQFASGEEENVLRSWNFFNSIIPSHKYWNCFNGKKDNSILFHIGGDLFFNFALSKVWKSIPIAYIEKEFWVGRFYRRIYSVKDMKLRNSISVGDLRFDFLPDNGFSETGKIALFPGSRAYGLKFYIPFYLALVKELIKDFNNLSFTMFFSPFINKAIKDKFIEKFKPLFEELPIKVEDLTDMNKVKNYLLAITLPGTNTIQLAYMKIPMFVVFPLHRPEFIPLEGLANIFKGKIRERLIEFYLSRNPYLALPNKLYPGIVPEIVGKFQLKDVVTFLKNSLYNRKILLKIHEDLKEKFHKDYLTSEIIWNDLYDEVLKEIV
ncbi:MAG: hypothetical protein ACK4SU_02145 [Dictyoglomus sp.]